MLPDWRGTGISQRLLAAVEQLAREQNCCKLTLEVLDGNVAARRAYAKYGFDGYQLDPAFGNALLLQKTL